MNHRMLWHDIRVSFNKSLGRFISIVCLVALGSFALVGLNVAGPDMRDAGNRYLAGHHLADLVVISSYGLDGDDRAAIDQAKGTSQVEYGYLKDVVLKGTDESLRVYSSPRGLSTYKLEAGHMPQGEDQVAIDSRLAERHPIGSRIQVDERADQLGRKVLRKDSLKVVGTVTSTEILSKVNMGPSTSGSGSLDAYATVAPEAFDSDEYMVARLSFKDLDGIKDHYSDRYTKALQVHKSDLNRILAGRPAARLASIKAGQRPKLDEAQGKIDQANKRLDDSRRQLDHAKDQLDEGARKIGDAKNQLSTQTDRARRQIDQARGQVDQGERDLAGKEKEYNASAQEVSDGRKQVEQGKKDADQAQGQIDQARRQLEEGRKKADDILNQAKEGRAKIGQAIEAVNRQIQAIQVELGQPGLSDEEKAALQAKLGQAQGQLKALQAQAGQLDDLVAKAQAGRDDFVDRQYKPAMAQLEDKQTQLDGKRKELATAEGQVKDGENRLGKAKGQLDQARTRLQQGRDQVARAERDLASSRRQAQGQIDRAQADLDRSQAEYRSKLDEFNKKEPGARRDIQDAVKKLDQATARLNQLEEPVYALDSRREAPGSEGYKVYASVSFIVDSLAKIFPYFLYFVAALVTFTTMTRFVDEERINSGTLKALGYSDGDVMAKFLVYGGISAAIGALLGIVAGHLLMPWIVYRAYANAFDLPSISYRFHWQVTLLACVLAFISAVVPAWLSAYRELREKPSALLLPKPPKAGSKILLERIPLVWNHMSFTHKVTARNIFRYKQRMFMTIFGVCGSVALLMTGFGVQGSISAINEHQFGKVIRYDLIAAENSHVSQAQRKAIDSRLAADDVRRTAGVRYEELSRVAGHNDDKQSITMIAPEDTDSFKDFIRLDTRSGHRPLALKKDGVIISERLAGLLGVGPGDTVTLQDSGGHDHAMPVDGVCEMYLGHFVFMSPAAYRRIFNQPLKANASLVSLKDSSTANTKRQAASFMRLDGVKGVVQNTTLMSQIDTVVSSLNMIMQVLIIVATLLTVVILYNLTNLNVEERIRELSTIKVLGFYDREVTMYIYRETILLSAIGVLVGYGFGAWLHHYIITTVPPDNVMFDPSVSWVAFMVPLVMIVVITAVLGWYVNRKLRNIDMLEALKSVE
ncbi:FtsX-like permease family protein [Bifidobacterium favimelis]|uniref:FtsX-like permease family protein n=1 Tax=Bifidobacterium favimelis TaxID=3122979 RepID=A0ABU8ZQ09_9BIFI